MTRFARTFLIVAFVSLAYVGLRGSLADAPSSTARWWKGNTHTHTLWSDGDGAPELVTAWYRDHGYQFLVLSDHNQLQEGERWFPVSEDGSARLAPAQLEDLTERFGDEAVAVRASETRRELRLWTLAELRAQFEAPSEFLLVTGEEVTAHFTREATDTAPKRDYPVHINAMNIAELVPPRGADSPSTLMNAAVAAIHDQGERLARPVLAHINHPNYGWGLTWRDLARLERGLFFEVYNGHRGVRNEGDAEHPSTERMWDLALHQRLTELGTGLLYGVATDDAHHYVGASRVSEPGRGWVVVRAEELSPEALVKAMRSGDFYSSSGVELDDVRAGDGKYVVDLREVEGVTYATRFIGARAGGEPGEVLLETDVDPAVYEFKGDELYVRAVVTSSRLHPNPFAEGDFEKAWCQPVRVSER